MYKVSQIWFLYAVSPVHMGAGNAVGELVDSPIQREKHTGYPLLPASGLKGALRHRVYGIEGSSLADEQVHRALFGSSPDDENGNLTASALSLTDGLIVAFPVRTLTGAYCYATSPTALARVVRLVSGAGLKPPPIPVIKDKPLAASAGTRVLETLAYQCDASDELQALAAWIAERALPGDDAYAYFRQKLAADMLLLPDEDFNHFVSSSTSIEPHVRIDNETGTAKGGGLFYVENAPPECLFLSQALFSDDRRDAGDKLDATVLAEKFNAELNGQVVQVGGDATYGRGHIVLHRVEG